MAYYDIWVSTNQFRSNSTLTYKSDIPLVTGSIVLVPFKNKQVLGLVKNQSRKPNFKLKSVSKLIIDTPIPSTYIKLFEWLINYYPSSASTHLKLFLPSILNKTTTPTIEKKSRSNHINFKLPSLTSEQNSAIKKIDKSNSNTILLHGSTGSGKTRVYIDLINKTFQQKKSTLLLIPEIGLSPQIINYLNNLYPNKIISINSALSNKIRANNWYKILASNEPIIVVGPRSALFAPINNLGLIIIDEAHDQSYKQESSPFYQTTRVAGKLSSLTGAKLIMGTATPLISDYYLFKIKDIPIVKMKKNAIAEDNKQKLEIKLIDLTDRAKFTKSSWLSDELINSIGKSLNLNQQSLLFLNRRGTATIVMCENCKWKAVCPNCNICLTYHQDKHQLWCHICGTRQPAPSKCPECSSSDILFKGAGTKAIESEVKKLFPKANIKRFDKDNSKLERLNENYDLIKSGKIDIIIGTQLITKGLDLPRLSTVGVIIADQNLSFPDFSSEEISFQTITQVIGRVGRGHLNESRIIIQTFNTENSIISSAIDKDYDKFYNEQIKMRKKYLFPPYVYIMKIYCSKNSPKNAEIDSHNIKKLIQSLGLNIYISDPAPAFREKIANKYIWQIVIKSKNRSNLIKIISLLPKNWSYDIDPNNLL